MAFMKRTITGRFFSAHERLHHKRIGLKIGHRVAEPANDIQAGFFRRVVERHRHCRCGDLAGLQRRKIRRGAARDYQESVIPRVFEPLNLERFFERCDDTAAKGRRA